MRHPYAARPPPPPPPKHVEPILQRPKTAPPAPPKPKRDVIKHFEDLHADKARMQPKEEWALRRELALYPYTKKAADGRSKRLRATSSTRPRRISEAAPPVSELATRSASALPLESQNVPTFDGWDGRSEYGDRTSSWSLKRCASNVFFDRVDAFSVFKGNGAHYRSNWSIWKREHLR